MGTQKRHGMMHTQAGQHNSRGWTDVLLVRCTSLGACRAAAAAGLSGGYGSRHRRLTTAAAAAPTGSQNIVWVHTRYTHGGRPAGLLHEEVAMEHVQAWGWMRGTGAGFNSSSSDDGRVTTAAATSSHEGLGVGAEHGAVAGLHPVVPAGRQGNKGRGRTSGGCWEPSVPKTFHARELRRVR